MKTIKQKDPSGCGIACVAMLVDKPYDKVKKKMQSLNLFEPRGYRTHYSDIKRVLKEYKKKSEVYYRSIKWKSLKKNAIVKINYNEKRETWHWVVYDKGKKAIRDPNSKNTFRTDERMRIHSYMYVYE